MTRNSAAIGIGLLVTSLYAAAIGVLDSTGGIVSGDEAFGYGVTVFLAATAGAWLLLALWHRRDGPR